MSTSRFSKIRLLFPALLIFAAVPSVSEAQTSRLSIKTTYCVQVQYEYWRSGVTYWSTVFETTSLNDALVMEALLLDALEDGDICDLLNCGFDRIIRDVRIKTKYEYPLYYSYPDYLLRSYLIR
ncbi:MAG: hypothetical protein Tsb009_09860 [Planctomycetaceae bacterium]